MTSTLRPLLSGFILPAFFALFLVMGPGCSSAEIDENDPAALMKDAEDDIESSRYILALEKLQKIKNQHPYSKQAVDAQLRIADVYFLQDNFAEAAASYEAFRDLHPKHPRLAYASYRIGISFFNDLPGLAARDLTSGYRAEEALNDFIRTFPTDENLADAKEKLAATRHLLAEKEMYIANFYYKREMWDAAKGRYSKVVQKFSDTPFISLAQERLKKIEALPPEKPEESR